MFKKIFFILSISALTTFSFANETCPTPVDLKNGIFKGWSVYDIDNGTPLSEEKLKKFKMEVKHFSLAEWMKDAPEGEAHCYYGLSVYLAKNNLIADTTLTYWHKLGSDVLQCDSGIELCVYQYSS